MYNIWNSYGGWGFTKMDNIKTKMIFGVLYLQPFDDMYYMQDDDKIMTYLVHDPVKDKIWEQFDIEE